MGGGGTFVVALVIYFNSTHNTNGAYDRVKLLLVATHLTPHIYDIGSKATPGFGIGLPPTATLHTLNSLLTLN